MTSTFDPVSPARATRLPAQSPSPAVPAGAREYAETRFRVGPDTQDGGTRISMRVGPWMHGPGSPATATATIGSLGVLIDDTIGTEIFRNRPPGTHSVTSELSLDVLVPPPWSGPHLAAQGTLLSRDRDGGLASCEVRDGDGRVVVVATGRCRFIPVETLPAPGGAFGPVLPPADHRSLRETLGLPVPADAAAPPRRAAAPRSAGTEEDLFDSFDLAELVERTGTTARLVVPSVPALENPHGTVHGGVLLCVSDLVTDALAGPSHPERTTSIRISFLRPGNRDHPVTYTAETVHRGRSLALYRVVTSGPAGKPCTIATITRTRRPAPDPAHGGR